MAAGLPVVLLLLAVALGAVGAVRTQLRCEDAAYSAVRAATRGEPNAVQAGRDRAPDGAEVSISQADHQVTVIVRASVSLLGTRLPVVHVSARAVAEMEP